MSINAITSVSLWEYYYKINREDEKKQTSPLIEEMQKYGLKPTDSDELNIAMLNRAKYLQQNANESSKEIPNYQRPWADLMYQLNLTFNEDAKDDIQDIKDELAKLLYGVSDNELEEEIKDLVGYVEDLYISFEKNYSTTKI